MCIRKKTLKVRTIKDEDNSKVVYFHDTLAELIVKTDTKTAHFRSPICKLRFIVSTCLLVNFFFLISHPGTLIFFATGGQGPHLFLTAGLRGEVSFVSIKKDADMGQQAHTASGIAAQRERGPVPVSGGTTNRFLLDHLSSKKTMSMSKMKAAPPLNFEETLKTAARRLSTKPACVTGKDGKMCQNGGTATGDVCTNDCGCSCPTGFSGDHCECITCPELKTKTLSGDECPDARTSCEATDVGWAWAVNSFVSCETGPTCDCKSGHGLSCKNIIPKLMVWTPTHNQALCGEASCSDDKKKSRLLNGASSTPSASSASTTNVTDFGGCCSSPELLSKTVLSATPFCRANPEQYTVVQVCLCISFCASVLQT